MDEVHTVIPLEYETPPPRRRGWRIGKIPGDAVLDVVAAGMILLVNANFIDEARGREIVALEAMASMAWTTLLLAGALTLILRSRSAPVIHRIYALGKLALALMAVGAAVTCRDMDLRLRVIFCALAGASFAVLMLRVGVMETTEAADLREPRP